jgi:hypothetical protein
MFLSSREARVRRAFGQGQTRTCLGLELSLSRLERFQDTVCGSPHTCQQNTVRHREGGVVRVVDENFLGDVHEV